MRKFLFLIFNFTFLILNFKFACYAKEITILYTSDTRAMIYPCSCPNEPDGGLARRAALIKELRKENPNTLVLDAGGFFAGGLLDENSQSLDLEKERARINLKAMELMRYDAAVIGDDEFNFGRQFLEENIANTSIFFLSCNLEPNNITLPYTIKEIAGVKIGIIGLASFSSEDKTGGLKLRDAAEAVKQAREELKNNGATFIVLLSHMKEGEDLNLLKGVVDGIDILIIGNSRSEGKLLTKIGSTLVLRSGWQGRRLGKLSLTIEDNRITGSRAEELRLSDKIRNDPAVSAILPRCFSDANCKKEGFAGICQNAGSLSSRCLFTEAAKINISIIMPKACRVCDTHTTLNYLRKQFPGLVVSYLYYPEAKASRLVKGLEIKTLPAYIFNRDIEREKGFTELKGALERKGDFYILKPQFSGLSYYLDRKSIKGKLDLLISLYAKNTAEVLSVIREFSPTVHFLAVQQGDGFDAARGNIEVEEYLRAMCVQRYYPQGFWDYITCRADSVNSTWWEDCLAKYDTARIKICARSQEGAALLRGNISLNKELKIMFGPTYLLDNQEIFTTQGAPSKKELKKVIKR